MHENILNEFRKLKGDGKVVLFGSLSRGTARFDSDIDIAVISDSREFIERSEKLADDILLEYGRVVSIIKFGKREFSEGHEPIKRDIMKGRVLYGG